MTSTTPAMRVALIGVGQMGSGILLRLLNAGVNVSVYDISQAARDRAGELGANCSASLASAVRSAETVVTMLPTAHAVEESYLGADGVRAHLPAGGLCIDMSTIDPDLAIRIGGEIAAAGGEFVDAPVSGGVMKAREGALTVMAGGAADAVARCAPLLNIVGSRVFHVGPTGSGSAAKLANNIVACSSMAATAEAFQLGISYGIDAETLTRILESSSGDTWILRNLHPIAGIRPDAPSSRDYRPGFSTTLAIEMLELASAAATAKRIPLTIVPAMLQLWRIAASHGYADKDFASVYEYLRRSTGPNQSIEPRRT